MSQQYHPYNPQSYAESLVENCNCMLPTISFMNAANWTNIQDLAEAFNIVRSTLFSVTALPYCQAYFLRTVNIRNKWSHAGQPDPFADMDD